jgi:hypothetical protein
LRTPLTVLKHFRVTTDDDYTHADRVVTIGVLARLSAWFLTPEAGGDHAMMERYRRDLGHEIGHAPPDAECHEQLEAQIARLRRSIGERW